MFKYIPILLTAICAACTTNSAGQKVVDPNVLLAIQDAAVIACGIAPTAEAVTNLYTNNPDVKTAEQAVALVCAHVIVPKVVVSDPAKP